MQQILSKDQEDPKHQSHQGMHRRLGPLPAHHSWIAWALLRQAHWTGLQTMIRLDG
jgi:hypothetical protein